MSDLRLCGKRRGVRKEIFFVCLKAVRIRRIA